ncbi:MAG: helix-turn-helix domain-containing protein [Candidatus Binataceae bacterium]
MTRDLFEKGLHPDGTGLANLAELRGLVEGAGLYGMRFSYTGSFWTTMADKDDILLNSREVAFLLDLSPDTVNELARRNVIPAFKKGRQWRFRKRDITSVKRHLRGVNAAA